MASRFYFPSTGAPAVVATPDASWEKTNEVRQHPLVRSKTGTAFSNPNWARDSGVGGDILALQFVSEPLEAQTISGTVKAQMRVSESNGFANVQSQCVIRVVSSDGSVVRGTLIASDTSVLSNEWPTTASMANRKFPKAWAGAGATLTSVAAQDGDRIVVELGGRMGDVSANAYTISLRYGDPSGTDLAEDETTTTDNVPWIEFSQTLFVAKAFVTAAGVVAISGSGPDFGVRTLLDLPAETDLSARLRKFTIRRGRKDNFTRVEAGTATSDFKNGSGAPLDPGNIDSPYYPNVRAGIRLQLARRKATVLYPRFTGRVERFVPTWVPPDYQEQQAVASDAFEALSGLKLASDKATLTTALTGSNNDLVFTAREEGGRGDDITIAYVVTGTNTTLDGGTNDPLDGEAIIEASQSAQSTSGGIGALGLLFGVRTPQAPTAFEVRGSEISITVATDGAGTPTSTAAQIKSFIEATPELDALVSVALSPGNSGAGVVTAMAATHLAGGKWPQEKTGARINRALDVVGWPADKRRIDPGLCEVVSQGFAKRDKVSALAHIQDCADSELGYVFISADDYVVYHDGGRRGRETRSTVSQATFADAQAGAGYLYSGIDPEYSRDHVFNRVSVTAGYQGAEAQVVEDLDSQLLYSPVPGTPVPREYEKNTLLASDADALAVAQAILAAYKDARVRFERITLKERAEPAGWTEAVMGRELGDRVTLRTKPPGHSTVGVYECFIEEIIDEGSPGQPVEVTFSLSLASEALDIPTPGGALLDSTGDDFVLDSGTAGVLG